LRLTSSEQAYHPTGDLESIVQKYGPLSSALVRFYAADLVSPRHCNSLIAEANAEMLSSRSSASKSCILRVSFIGISNSPTSSSTLPVVPLSPISVLPKSSTLIPPKQRSTSLRRIGSSQREASSSRRLLAGLQPTVRQSVCAAVSTALELTSGRLESVCMRC